MLSSFPGLHLSLEYALFWPLLHTRLLAAIANAIKPSRGSISIELIIGLLCLRLSSSGWMFCFHDGGGRHGESAAR
jgi:hypothetical protein